MYKRKAEKIIKSLSRLYPIVAITGPRQSGKTTLVKAIFRKKKYISLEDLDQRAFAKQDPKAFLNQDKNGLVIDEAQNFPALFSYMQGVVDKNQKPGHFIITGSQQFGLLSGITQSLAGRVGLVELLPFSLSEISPLLKNLNSTLYKGLYPPLYDKNFPPHIWYEDYVKTYIERDVRKLINIKDLSLFQKFVSLCAGRAGQLINYSELSNVAGIDTKTVQSWISVLSASYIIFLLKPHHKNFSKKLVKTPKLYFYDPGLLCYLLHLRVKDLSLSPYKGAIFESLIISEFFKHNKNYRKGMDFYFWRDNKGMEVDLLFQKNSKLFPVEIKSSQTIHNDFFRNLKKYQKYSGSEHGQSFLVYGGEEAQKRSSGRVIPWKKLNKLF